MLKKAPSRITCLGKGPSRIKCSGKACVGEVLQVAIESRQGPPPNKMLGEGPPKNKMLGEGLRGRGSAGGYRKQAGPPHNKMLGEGPLHNTMLGKGPHRIKCSGKACVGELLQGAIESRQGAAPLK